MIAHLVLSTITVIVEGSGTTMIGVFTGRRAIPLSAASAGMRETFTKIATQGSVPRIPTHNRKNTELASEWQSERQSERAIDSGSQGL